MDLEQIAKTARHNHNVADAGVNIIREARANVTHSPYINELCLLYDREHKEFVISDIGNTCRIDAARSPPDKEADSYLDVDPKGYLVQGVKHAWDLLNIAIRYGVRAAVSYESAMFVSKSFVAVPVKVPRAPVVARPRMQLVYTSRDEIRERFLELSAQALGVPYSHNNAA